MKNEMEEILNENKRYSTLPADQRNDDDLKELLTKLKNFEAKLGKYKDHVITRSAGIGNRGNNPYVAIRPDMGKGNGKVSDGVYLNYIFDYDGSHAYLVIGLSTEDSNSKHAHHLETLKKIFSDARFIKPPYIEEGPTEINSNDTTKFGEGAVFYIKYDNGTIPNDNVLNDQLKGMAEFLDKISDKCINNVVALDKIKQNLKKNSKDRKDIMDEKGNKVSNKRALTIIRNFALLQQPEYNYRDGASLVGLTYTEEEWECIANVSDFFRAQTTKVGQEIRKTFSWASPTEENNSFDELTKVIKCQRYVVLEGPPGVGKSHFYSHLIENLECEEHRFVTFNPATEYSDFIGGLTPITPAAGTAPTVGLTFTGVNGVFLDALLASKDKKSLLWIDEINRGNVSKIFGELIGLLGTDDPEVITIPNVAKSNRTLVPGQHYNMNNFYIIGTINTADTSIANMDLALRRRFSFVRMYDDVAFFNRYDEYKLRDTLPLHLKTFCRLNAELNEFGSDARLGHSYLFLMSEASTGGTDEAKAKQIWENSILPTLAETLVRLEDENLTERVNEILSKLEFGLHEIGRDSKTMCIGGPITPGEESKLTYRNEDETVNVICDLFNHQKNIILEGVPGVGKTRMAKKVWEKMEISQDNTSSIVFGPATEPEDFVGGLFPEEDTSFPPPFKFKAGSLLEIAEKAASRSDEKFGLYIDEINRANVPKVLGHVMTVLESTKRFVPGTGISALSDQPGSKEDPYRVLMFHEEGKKKYLGLPNNLYILGAMNTSDRSVIQLDLALRRRFSFVRVETMVCTETNEELLSTIKMQFTIEHQKVIESSLKEYIDALIEINSALNTRFGRDGMLGHSYLFNPRCCLEDENPITTEFNIVDPDMLIILSYFVDKEKRKLKFTPTLRNDVKRLKIDYDKIMDKLKTDRLISDETNHEYELTNPPTSISDLRQKLNVWRTKCCTKWLQDRLIFSILPQIADTLNAQGVESEKSEDYDDITKPLERLWKATFSKDEQSKAPSPRLHFYDGAMGGWRVDIK